MNNTKTVGADRPLADPRDDVLGYAPFAKQLAHTLLRNSPAEGFVIAIYGAWGTGKSTALNFIVHYMEQDPEEDAPVIVRFNPWWFAGSEDLVRRFFAQFESVVFAARARKTKFKSAFERFASAVAEVPFASVQAAGKLGAAAARATQTTDLVRLKEELSAELAKQPQRIVVIMDDIDRLVADEVRQLFRLIKAVADFPNVTYVLAFDREVASRALSEMHSGRGDMYLEKIVQAPFELPLPDRTQLRTLLASRISQVVGSIPDSEFDPVYWGNVFLDGIDPFVTKPRDVVRLVNALAVTFPAVQGEVNVVDFVALETVRVFSPPAYDILRSNPDQFLTGSMDRWASDEARASLRAFHDGWLSTVGEHRPRIQALLERLFPRLDSLWSRGWGSTIYDGKTILEWRRAKRVCAPEIFPIYFRLSVPPGAISNAEFEGALTEEQLPVLAKRLRSLASQPLPDGRTRVTAMLDRLNDYARDETSTAPSRAVSVLHALFDAGDFVLTQGAAQRAFFDIDDEVRLHFAVRNFLKRIPAEQRAATLKRSVETGSALGTVVREVVRLGLDLGKYEGKPTSPEEQLLPESEVEHLERLVLVRLTAAAKDGTLWKAPHLLSNIKAWRVLAGDDRALQWLKTQTANDGRLAQVLEQFVSRGSAHGMRDRVPRQFVRVSLKHVESYFDLDALVPRLRVLGQRSGWSEQQRTAMRLIVEAYDRRAAGKPDPFLDMD